MSKKKTIEDAKDLAAQRGGNFLSDHYETSKKQYL